MPGIAGIISPNRSLCSEVAVDRMLRCMMHEEYYSYGKHIGQSENICLGWVCHKEASADCMPLQNEEKQITLITAGENFPSDYSSEVLRKKGINGSTNQLRNLLTLYETLGDGYLQTINGWLSGIIIDSRKNEASLFNDRYGMQRIYYYETKDAFYFSSEAKSILALIPSTRTIDQQGLAEMIGCGAVLENRSLFQGIHQLPGGSNWKFKNGKCFTRNSYYDRSVLEKQAALDEEEYYQQFKNTFCRVLKRYNRPGENVALSLTGGFDTRMIMACRDSLPDSMPCYTFGGMYRDSRDVLISRILAERSGRRHHTIKLQSDFLRHFDKYAERSVYISDGCLDAGSSYELYFNHKARHIANIRLTGNMGSEVTRSSGGWNLQAMKRGWLNEEFQPLMNEAVELFNRIKTASSRLTFALYAQAPWYEYGRLSVEQSQVTLRTPFMDTDLVRLIYQAPARALDNAALTMRFIRECNPVMSDIPTDRGRGKKGVSGSILRMQQELLFKAEYIYNYGMPDWMMKIDMALRPLQLEKLFLGRHKFHHYRKWYGKDLNQYVKDVLLDRKSLNRNHVNKYHVEKMIKEHSEGRANHTIEITTLLTIELIYSTLIERETESRS